MVMRYCRAEDKVSVGLANEIDRVGARLEDRDLARI
jgi:hypothetical protein